LPEKRDSSGVPDAEDYIDMTLAHKTPTFTASELQQNQDPTEMLNFSVSFLSSAIFGLLHRHVKLTRTR